MSPKAGVKHHTMLSVSEEMNERLVVASAPTKTFNIPGVIVSYMIIPNEDLRNRIGAVIDRIGMHNPNIFAVTAVETAYTKCDDWYEAVKKYIDENEAFTRAFSGAAYLSARGNVPALDRLSGYRINGTAIGRVVPEKGKCVCLYGKRIRGSRKRMYSTECGVSEKCVIRSI